MRIQSHFCETHEDYIADSQKTIEDYFLPSQNPTDYSSEDHRTHTKIQPKSTYDPKINNPLLEGLLCPCER